MKSQARAAAWACIVCLSLFTISRCVDEVRHRPEARREMRDFMVRAQLGDTKEQVRQKFGAGSHKILSLRANLNADLWSVSTPFEFGAGNWILWLEFERDKLRAMRLRIADGMTHRPRDAAPPDKVAPGWPQKFSRS